MSAAAAESDEHQPCPDWAIAGVLLSPDLLHIILSAKDVLNAWDCAVPCVCRQWLHTWNATLKQRRGLREVVPLDLGEDPTGLFATTPDAATLCWCPVSRNEARNDVHVYDGGERMCRLRTIRLPVEYHFESIHISPGGAYLYATHCKDYEPFESAGIMCHRLDDGRLVAHYERDDLTRFAAVDVGPEGVFILAQPNAYSEANHFQDSLLTLDLDTLERRCERGIESFAVCLAFGSGELFVGEDSYTDTNHADAVRIGVYAPKTGLTGPMVRDRSFRSSWDMFDQLCFVTDRLYVAEPTDCGGRLFVLTPHGETLQIFGCATWRSTPYPVILDLLPFGNQLFVQLFHVEYLYESRDPRRGECEYTGLPRIREFLVLLPGV